MSTTYRYALPVEQTAWKFNGNTETCFTWEYDDRARRCCNSMPRARSSKGTPPIGSTGRSILIPRTR